MGAIAPIDSENNLIAPLEFKKNVILSIDFENIQFNFSRKHGCKGSLQSWIESPKEVPADRHGSCNSYLGISRFSNSACPLD